MSEDFGWLKPGMWAFKEVVKRALPGVRWVLVHSDGEYASTLDRKAAIRLLRGLADKLERDE